MVRLKDVGKIITGNTPKTSEKENYESNDICFVKPSDIEDDSISYIEETENFIAECAREKARILPVNSVLVTCIGIIGKIGINKVECAFNQQINAIVPNEEICLAQYLAYAIKSKKFLLQDIANAPVVPILNKTQFADVEIKIVDLKEQERIVHRLAKVEALIDQRKQQFQKLDELVKARFVEMFGDEFSEFNKLGNLASVTGGLTKNSKRKDLELKLPYLRVANVYFNKIDTKEILEIGLTEEEYKKTVLEYGDLLFVEGNGSPEQIGRVAVWRDEVVNCVHQNHIIKARFDKCVMHPMFVMHYFMSVQGREQIKSKAVSTSGLHTLSVSKISDLDVPIVEIALQNKFVYFVEQINKSKLHVQKSLDKLETLKKALMQKYFG